MKPFLKWPGGKYRIINKIKSMLPQGDRLIEPFAGSAAVFLNTDYPQYLVADINRDLINLFITLTIKGNAFIDLCYSYFNDNNNTEEKYYELREEFNRSEDIVHKSALFVYLGRHGYNGLVRYNSKGWYNVPFGRYSKPYFPRNEMLHFIEKARIAEFICSDFEDIMRLAVPGKDVIYCDPPYIGLSETSNFTTYSSGGFGINEQIKLAKIAREISNTGVPVLISNHDTDFIRELYAGAKIMSFEVQRNISCNGDNRNKVREILALFGGES